ncbi:hypothetical protein [Eisenibacter elegans]|jgi:hypothetical protein|uniref:hypothetical protein n=1 Tax=Eisenibacter elegans TaxID=997 RepID=UPI0004095991|nr:hypothetical protein [Eisenibacter elegans]
MLQNNFNEYKQLRPETQLNAEGFQELVLLYPLLYVLQSDDRVDDFERAFLNAMVTHRNQLQDTAQLDALKQELAFMQRHRGYAEAILLDTLKHLVHTLDLQRPVLDWMVAAAQASANDFSNNLLYSTHVPQWLRLPRWVLGGFLHANTEKKFISENEKEAILYILNNIDALTPENKEYLSGL